MTFCSECKDQFDPVEYRHPDPDGPNFCSSECEDRWWVSLDYDLERNSGAPVF